MNNRIFKNDKYRKNRGGYTRLISVICLNCEEKILEYQKDGPGALKRIYIDRIIYPKNLKKLKDGDVKDIKLLKCPNCQVVIGSPYIYKKENRKSFKVFQDSIIKKIIKIN